jgi:hypothetical protein
MKRAMVAPAREEPAMKKSLKATVEAAFTRALVDAQNVADGMFEYDAQGHKIRKFTRENPCGRTEVLEALVGNRGVDKWEVVEIVGMNTFQFMVKEGLLVKDTLNAYYHVTLKAAKKYGLPKVNGMPFLDL